MTEQQTISKAKVPMRQWVYLGLMLVILGLVLIPTLFPEVFVSQETPRLTRPVLQPVEPPPVVEAVVPVEPPPPPFRHDLALEMARPHIDAAARRNLKAVDEAIAAFRIIFKEMRVGVPAFAEELNSMSGKWRLARYGVNDTWNKYVSKEPSTRVRDRVVSRFRTHIITESELERRISHVIEDLEYKLTASHNRMLAAIQSDIMVEHTDFVPPAIYSDELYKLLQETCADQRVRLLAISFGGEAAALVLSEITVAVVIRIITRMVTASGSAAAGSAAAGAAATTTATAIGGAATLGVGLIVAVGVDMVISHISEKRMITQMNEMISGMENEMIAGNAQATGVRDVLLKYVGAFNQSQASGVEKAIRSLK